MVLHGGVGAVVAAAAVLYLRPRPRSVRVLAHAGMVMAVAMRRQRVASLMAVSEALVARLTSTAGLARNILEKAVHTCCCVGRTARAGTRFE